MPSSVLPRIVLPRIDVPVPPVTQIPRVLLAIRLPPAGTAPIWLEAVPEGPPTRTPVSPLPIGWFPLPSVPIALARTAFALARTIHTPLCVLPEITFPAPAGVPPTVLPEVLKKIPTPSPLARAAVPAAVVPMKLPWMTLPSVPRSVITRPIDELPEMTLREAAVVPPI